MHDPRICRFFAVDPLTAQYPHYTPYSFSGNKLIHAVELEGLEEEDYVDDLLENLFTTVLEVVTDYVVEQTIEIVEQKVEDVKEEIEYEYENVKVELEKNNAKIFVGGEGNIDIGPGWGVKGKVYGYGAGGKLDLFSLDLFGVKSGFELDKDGVKPVLEFYSPFIDGYLKAHGEASATLGGVSGKADYQFEVHQGNKGVANSKTTYGGGVGPVQFSTSEQAGETTNSASVNLGGGEVKYILGLSTTVDIKIEKGP